MIVHFIICFATDTVVALIDSVPETMGALIDSATNTAGALIDSAADIDGAVIDSVANTGGALINSATDTSRRIFESHLGRRDVDKKYLIDQLGEIAASVTDFAFSQPLFVALKREDQVCLLQNNIPPDRMISFLQY